MGCTSSKQARRHLHRNLSGRLFNSRSMPATTHATGADLDHRITLKSCTLGSLKLDHDISDEAMMKASNDDHPKLTPAPAPETINAWELMEGLEDVTPIGTPCKAMQYSTPFTEYVDPEVVSSFRKTLVELSPQHRKLLRSPEPEKMASGVLLRRSKYEEVEVDEDESCRKTPDLTGIVRTRIMEFQERIDAKKGMKVKQRLESWVGGGGKVVIYMTSLRGVRETYNECKEVREIMRSYKVRVDERDVSMDRGFKEELNEVLGKEGGRLPSVFVKGEYLGGVEEVRRMHEGGELGKVIDGCEMVKIGKGGGGGGGGGDCEECGEVRFVLCGRCSGSCKVFVEDDDGDDDGGYGYGGGFWCRCPECNENGLVRCSLCC
ncbi:Glutaredoxin-related protein [Dioscorea alata]|uniref:Glutaredoxin-related protein n=2 Tax=Dioscorea alata TaxID=55571 RepID=A0ACB7U7R7_DIOAL|nr:Glutaredoxin-related protein [Dioscorea alata]KAH7656307.1 Glutaredoxin-related protein [Dioscorea alata]